MTRPIINQSYYDHLVKCDRCRVQEYRASEGNWCEVCGWQFAANEQMFKVECLGNPYYGFVACLDCMSETLLQQSLLITKDTIISEMRSNMDAFKQRIMNYEKRNRLSHIHE